MPERQIITRAWSSKPCAAVLRAPASVFQLAQKPLKPGRKRSDVAAGKQKWRKVKAGDGITRVEGYASTQIVTDEELEREYQRRARQVVPKPLAKFRTRGKGVRIMDGEE